MQLETGMLITLTDNKQYIVGGTQSYENKDYVFLVENKKYQNVKFCFEEQDKNSIKLTEVEDVALRQLLLGQLARKIQNETK